MFSLEDRGLIFDTTQQPPSGRIAYFTSLCVLQSGTILCGCQNGPKKHAATSTIRLSRSVDGGRSWFKLGGLPTVAVDDIHLQERDRDLIVATHGRSLYVIDDITGLELLTPAVRAEAAHLFPPRSDLGFVAYPGFADWNGSAS